MKKLFILLFSIGTVACASAQTYGHVIYDRGPNVTIGVGDNHYGVQRRIEDINREYDRRIWDIRNDPRLRPHEKRKTIRILNREREYKIRSIRRYRMY